MIKIELHRMLKSKKNLVLVFSLMSFSFLLIYQLHLNSMKYNDIQSNEYFTAGSVAKKELNELIGLGETSEVIQIKEYWETEKSLTSQLKVKYGSTVNGDIFSTLERTKVEQKRLTNLIKGFKRDYNTSYLLITDTMEKVEKELELRNYLILKRV